MDSLLHSLESDPIEAKFIAKVIKWKETGKPSGLSEAQQEKWKDAVVSTHAKLGKVLMLDDRIVLDYVKADKLIENAWKDPTTGYQSAEKLWNKLRQTFVGVSRRHVEAVVNRFEVHQIIGIKHAHTPVKPIVGTKPFKYLQADLIDRQGFATTNGHSYLMTIVDIFSKYAFVVPLKNKTSGSIIAGLEQVLAKIGPGIVKVLHTDNGSEFKNEEVRTFLETKGIKPVYGQAYRYQSQGVVERFNQTIQMMIHRYLLQNRTNRYTEVLPTLVQNYNESLHETTKHKPIDLIQPANTKEIKIAKKNIQTQADKVLMRQQREFPAVEVGDYVRVLELKFQKEKAKIFDVKYRPDIYRVVSMRFHGNDYTYKITNNLRDLKEGPFETVSRFQIKKIPKPELLIKPVKVVPTPSDLPRPPKLLAEKVHKPRVELAPVPELRRSERVPQVRKALAAGETKRGKSYRRPAQ